MAMILRKLKQWQERRSKKEGKVTTNINMLKKVVLMLHVKIQNCVNNSFLLLEQRIEDECDDNYDTVDLDDIAPAAAKEPVQEKKVFDVNEATKNHEIVENTENPYYDGVYDFYQEDEDEDFNEEDLLNTEILQIEENPYYDDSDNLDLENKVYN